MLRKTRKGLVVVFIAAICFSILAYRNQLWFATPIGLHKEIRQTPNSKEIQRLLKIDKNNVRNQAVTPLLHQEIFRPIPVDQEDDSISISRPGNNSDEHHQHKLKESSSKDISIKNITRPTTSRQRRVATPIYKETHQKMNSKEIQQAIDKHIANHQSHSLQEKSIPIDLTKESNIRWSSNNIDEHHQLKDSSSKNVNISINNITYPEQLSVHLQMLSSAAPWFTLEDFQKMAIMSTANISSRFDIESHERLKGLIFDLNGTSKIYSRKDCGPLNCGILKRSEDLKEVFAFHLDRVLGIKRTPAAVATKRKDGSVKPVFLWITDILRIKAQDSFQPDQNSFFFTYAEYLKELDNLCNSVYLDYSYYNQYSNNNTVKNISEKSYKTKCKSPIKHIEWSKLAIFDFLLQIYDRLDRNCCGLDVSEGERCLDELHSQIDCTNPDQEHLVHIFTRKNDDSARLIYIDNNANMGRSEDHLNLRLLQGIHEVPENVINALKSGDLERNLIKSLHIDSIFWEASGGEETVAKLIGIISKRSKILLEYIEKRTNSIQIVPDY